MELTIEQAIEHCKEVATHCGIKDCEEEHLQLANWLKELQKYKQDDFIELEAYYNEPYNQVHLISIKRSEILQFYETFTILNIPCTLIITKHGNFKINLNYNELKGLLQ